MQGQSPLHALGYKANFSPSMGEEEGEGERQSDPRRESPVALVLSFPRRRESRVSRDLAPLCTLSRSDDIEEIFVQSGVGSNLGVKGDGQQLPLPGRHGGTVR